MKTKISLIAFYLFVYTSFAQTRQQVDVKQNFEVGKKYLYELQMTNYDSKEPLSEKVKLFTQIEFNILREDKGLKLCSWKYGASRIEGYPVQNLDEKTRKLINTNKGHEIKFTIDQEGSFEEVTNYDECKKRLDSSFKVLYTDLAKNQKPDIQEKVLNMLKKTYSNPEIMINTHYPDISIFFGVFGATLYTDSTYTIDTELENPLGGRNFPAKQTFKVSRIESNVATIEQNTFIEPAILTKTIIETMENMSKDFEKPLKKEDIEKLPKLDIKTQVKYYFDSSSNSLKEVFFERKTENNDHKKIKTYKVIHKK